MGQIPRAIFCDCILTFTPFDTGAIKFGTTGGKVFYIAKLCPSQCLCPASLS